MDVQLTKSAKKSIAQIYKEYLRRVKDGESKEQATFFSSGNPDQAELINSVKPDFSLLNKAGFVTMDVLDDLELKDAAIVYMENLTPETIKEWLSFVANFIP